MSTGELAGHFDVTKPTLSAHRCWRPSSTRDAIAVSTLGSSVLVVMTKMPTESGD